MDEAIKVVLLSAVGFVVVIIFDAIIEGFYIGRPPGTIAFMCAFGVIISVLSVLVIVILNL